MLQCPSCHNAQRSACGKSGCKKDEMKPKMILPVAALNQKKNFKKKNIGQTRQHRKW